MSSKSEGMTQKPGNGERSFTPHRSTMRPKVATVGLRARRSKDAGFTLIELMVILAIAVILAAVVGVGVVRVRSKREEVPGLRRAADVSGTKIYDEQTSRLCDPSDIERLQQLSPEGRKATAPTYAERLKKAQEREDTLLYLLAALAEDEAFWKQQPASAERSERLQKLREKFDRTVAEYEMVKQSIKSNKKCLALSEAGAPSPVPPPRAPTRTPPKTVPSSSSTGGVTRTPVPIQETAPTPGVEPPHMGPPDSG